MPDDLTNEQPIEQPTSMLPTLQAIQMPHVFANHMDVRLNKSDVSLLFSNELDGILVPSVRVVMTHKNFCDMANGLDVYRLLIEELYGGTVPMLPDVDTPEYKRADELAVKLAVEKRLARRGSRDNNK